MSLWSSFLKRFAFFQFSRCNTTPHYTLEESTFLSFISFHRFILMVHAYKIQQKLKLVTQNRSDINALDGMCFL